MDTPITDFVRAGSLEELKAKGRLVAHGPHRPILVVHDKDRVFALDNRCPHMGFPLDRGSVEDGTLTCHWHHARFDLASGCTFDRSADHPFQRCIPERARYAVGRSRESNDLVICASQIPVAHLKKPARFDCPPKSSPAKVPAQVRLQVSWAGRALSRTTSKRGNFCRGRDGNRSLDAIDPRSDLDASCFSNRG
jgi:nitrite reductase/ring-hydroxylating ferredoxin subunit